MVQIFNLKLKAEFVVFRVNKMNKYLPLGFLKQLGFVSWRITDDKAWCWASMYEIIHVHLNPSVCPPKKPVMPEAEFPLVKSSSNTIIKELSAAKTPNSVFKSKSQNLMPDFFSPTTPITT